MWNDEFLSISEEIERAGGFDCWLKKAQEETKKWVESFGCTYCKGDSYKGLPHNALLRIFTNPSGVPYCEIYYNGHEIASAEKWDEAGLVSWWNTEGHFMWERR